jgi:hypothetical protein
VYPVNGDIKIRSFLINKNLKNLSFFWLGQRIGKGGFSGLETPLRRLSFSLTEKRWRIENGSL